MLLKSIFKMRLDDAIGMNQKAVLEADDPRRISPTLAPIPPPPTHEIAAQQRSRFNVQDPDATLDYDHTRHSP